MTRARPVIQRETVKCPFCGKGDIELIRTLDWYSEHRAHAAGRSAMIPHYHPEKIEIRNKCPNCGKSKKNLKEAIERGTSKEMSHEERLKRIKAAGLPTKIES